jgi:hypothetical protein
LEDQFAKSSFHQKRKEKRLPPTPAPLPFPTDLSAFATVDPDSLRLNLKLENRPHRLGNHFARQTRAWRH